MKAWAESTRSLRGAFIGVAGVYVFGLPLTFFSQILLARLVSVEDFGAFGFALSIAALASIPVAAGLPMLLTREVSGYLQAGNISKYRGLVRRAHHWVAITSIALFPIFPLLTLFDFTEGSSKSEFILIGFLVPLFGLNSIRSGIMKGLGHASISEGPTQVLQPLLLIAGYLVLSSLGLLTLLSALGWYFVSNLIVFLVSYAILLVMQPSSTRLIRPNYDDQRRWLRAILPFAAMSMVWSVSAQLGVLLLGILSDNEAVAAMRVAERGAMLISFPLMFINATIGPHIVAQFEQNESDKLQYTLRFGARLAVIAALPILAVLTIAGRSLLSITFGEEYSDIAYGPMMVLVLGQMISILLGPAGILLVMTGLERLNLVIQLVALAFFLMTTVLLIGELGALGAAIGAAVHVVLASILAYWAALKRRKLRTSII